VTEEVPPPTTRIVHEMRIAMTVAQYEEAVAFYRDALGLREVESWDRPDGRGTILDAGHATLELFDSRMAESLDAIEVGRRVSGTIRFALEVDDSIATAERLVEHGATREAEVVVTSWRDQNVRVRAPDGMQLTLFTHLEQE
jgi:catechol 2,3-dioxygenase-like lactoylglutathione lyase family enzyme